MAEASECRMRLQEYRDIGGGILGDMPEHIKAASPQILNITLAGTPADVAGFSEISAPTNILDESIAVQFETISGSANDNLTAGAHAQKIMAIGINQLNKMVTVELDGHSTDWTTFVLHDETMKCIFHTFCSKWGTGDKDNAGQIDVRKIDDTILLSILAAGNESNGSRFKVPDGHCAMLYNGRMMRFSNAIDEGVRLRIYFVNGVDGQSGLVAGDRHLNYHEVVVNRTTMIQTHLNEGRVYESGTWIYFEHSSLIDAGEEYSINLKFLIWKK